MQPNICNPYEKRREAMDFYAGARLADDFASLLPLRKQPLDVNLRTDDFASCCVDERWN